MADEIGEQLYRAIGRIEGGVDAIHKRLDSHAETSQELQLKLEAHREDIEAHGLKAIRQAAISGINWINIGMVLIMALAAIIQVYHGIHR